MEIIYACFKFDVDLFKKVKGTILLKTLNELIISCEQKIKICITQHMEKLSCYTKKKNRLPRNILTVINEMHKTLKNQIRQVNVIIEEIILLTQNYGINYDGTFMDLIIPCFVQTEIYIEEYGK